MSDSVTRPEDLVRIWREEARPHMSDQYWRVAETFNICANELEAALRTPSREQELIELERLTKFFDEVPGIVHVSDNKEREMFAAVTVRSTLKLALQRARAALEGSKQDG